MPWLHRFLNIPYCGWICQNMPDYTRIWVNVPRIAWIAFLHVSTLILCVFECMVTYFNSVYSLTEHETVFLKRQTHFFCSSWKDLICFLVLDEIFLHVRLKISSYLWESTGPGAVIHDVPNFNIQWTSDQSCFVFLIKITWIETENIKFRLMSNVKIFPLHKKYTDHSRVDKYIW